MNANEISKEVMNEIEFERTLAFTEDKIMFEAVKKFILFHIFSEGTAKPGEPLRGDRNWALQMGFQSINPNGMPRSNEELGADVRAFAKATNIVESGFKELAELKRPEAPEVVEPQHI